MTPSLAPTPSSYVPRDPSQTVLYRVVADHLETFLASLDADPDAKGLPAYVERELYDYLQCGILAHGFLRLGCDTCQHEMLLAFSCKRRGFCPSCAGRRMAQTAAHLVECVIPWVPTRQWVVSVPVPLRYWMAASQELTAKIHTIIRTTIGQHYVNKAVTRGFERANMQPGSVTFIQRFGSAINLNIHLHCLVLDGVYRNNTAVFHEVAAPTLEELQALLAKIITCIMRWLTKQGFLIEEQDRTYLAEADRESALLPLQAASCTYRIALGPRAGQKVLSLQSVASPDKSSTPDLCAKLHGFSLHAAVRWGADQRKELEHLCRYITRPAIANERLKRNRAGDVVLQLKSAFKDGTTHIVMAPLEFMQRLAALVPRPRLHLIRFHGVMAPNAKLRSEIIPSPVEQATEPACDHAQAQGASARMSWARLLKRVFDIDIEHCPNCGGSLKIIAAIEDPPVIVRILTHLGLPTRAPPQRVDLFQTI